VSETSIAEFTLGAREFPLGTVFEEYPAAFLELDRVVPSGDTVMPYFWVHHPDGRLREIRDLFEDLSELRSIILMEELGEKGLYRAEWEPEYIGIMGAIATAGVTVLFATGSKEGWTFELRARDMDQLSAFQQDCERQGIDVSLARLTQLSEASSTEFGLTSKQREALILAYNEGYYWDSRETDLETLAAELGITRQALSSRLRRGYRNLIGSTIAHDPPGEA
jgi:predicted DNA binding protein